MIQREKALKILSNICLASPSFLCTLILESENLSGLTLGTFSKKYSLNKSCLFGQE